MLSNRARKLKKLCVNVGINAADVTLLHNAVSDVSHTKVCLETPNGLHAGTHVVTEPRFCTHVLERVETLSIDELVQFHALKFPIIAKLDVEGQELAALGGAEKALKGETLLIYEEHGSKRECEVTKFLIEQGFRVHFLREFGVLPIQSKREASDYMKRKTVGYNFAASRIEWINRRITTLLT